MPITQVRTRSVYLDWVSRPLSVGTHMAYAGSGVDAGTVFGFPGCEFGGGFRTYHTPPRTYGADVRLES